MSDVNVTTFIAGVSSLGVLGVPWHPQILADHLTLSQPVEADYAPYITTGTPGFSDLPTALSWFTQTDSTILQWAKSFIKSVFDLKVEPAQKKVFIDKTTTDFSPFFTYLFIIGKLIKWHILDAVFFKC